MVIKAGLGLGYTYATHWPNTHQQLKGTSWKQDCTITVNDQQLLTYLISCSWHFFILHDYKVHDNIVLQLDLVLVNIAMVIPLLCSFSVQRELK